MKYTFKGFTEKANAALNLAIESAEELGHSYIGSEHILLGLCKADSGVAYAALSESGVTADKVEELILSSTRQGESETSLTPEDFTPRTKRVMQTAMTYSARTGSGYVGTEHLLIALLSDRDSYAIRYLAELGVSPQSLANTLGAKLSGDDRDGYEPTANGAQPKGDGATKTLDSFSRDLTEAARKGEIDPVIGREEEIRRIIQILSRRTKNNPCLIGEPGVGKTAVAEGLALKIANGEVPEHLRDKRVVALDLTGMIAGTKYRGDFEDRIKNAIDEVKNSKNIILFIDELHTIIGAGSAEGSADAANILKPSLARGDFQVIGATTLDEYRKYIEKDAALERRFQTIVVNPPNAEDSILILDGLRAKYEAHHKVRYTPDAVRAAVLLAERYISERFLPDKAIDVLDETGARVRLDSICIPQDLKDLEDELAETKRQLDDAVANQNFETAASLRDKTEELEKQVMERRDALSADKESETIPVVDENAIRDCISKMTGIPVSRLAGEEAKKLLHLGDEIKERVIGQDQAVDAVVKAIRRTRAGIRDTKRPMGSFLFLGPTGVGKTELAKVLSLSLFGSEDSMIRIDMSEYMEKHSISRLIGAPPGYVGFEESGGQLSEKVRKRPYSVVLLDEIEKAHPDIYNLLLQILDDGILTDSYGRKINFKNTIIIMTSNAGAREVRHSSGMGFTKMGETDDYERMETAIREEVKRVFSPEFLNRIDEQIVFRPLSKADLVSVVDIQLSFLQKNLSERGILLEVTQEAKEFIVNHNYDSALGARPIRRTIQNLVEDEIAEGLLLETMTDFSTITIGVKDGKLSFACEKIPEDGTNPG